MPVSADFNLGLLVIYSGRLRLFSDWIHTPLPTSVLSWFTSILYLNSNFTCFLVMLCLGLSGSRYCLLLSAGHCFGEEVGHFHQELQAHTCMNWRDVYNHWGSKHMCVCMCVCTGNDKRKETRSKCSRKGKRFSVNSKYPLQPWTWKKCFI